jgi:D-proline reductase (dithiol) PrdB
VGLFARAIEEAGIPTTSITSALDITRLVRPPRTVFVNFPLGHQTGKPFERALQTSIVKDALNALRTIEEPGIILDLPYRWSDDDNWEQHVTIEETEDAA